MKNTHKINEKRSFYFTLIQAKDGEKEFRRKCNRYEEIRETGTDDEKKKLHDEILRDLDSYDGDGSEWLKWNMIATGHSTLGNIEKAVEIDENQCIKFALEEPEEKEKNRKLSVTYNNLCDGYRRLRNADKAIECGMKALHYDDNNEGIWKNYALALIYGGKEDEGIQILKKLRELSNWDEISSILAAAVRYEQDLIDKIMENDELKNILYPF